MIILKKGLILILKMKNVGFELKEGGIQIITLKKKEIKKRKFKFK